MRDLADDDGRYRPAGVDLLCHGVGVCLSVPDGEMFDVDFNDDAGSVIDVWFFANRVQSVKT